MHTLRWTIAGLWVAAGPALGVYHKMEANREREAHLASKPEFPLQADVEASYQEHVVPLKKYSVDELRTLTQFIQPHQELGKFLQEIQQVLQNHNPDESLRKLFAQHRPDLTKEDLDYTLYLVAKSRHSNNPVESSIQLYNDWADKVLSKTADPETVEKHKKVATDFLRAYFKYEKESHAWEFGKIFAGDGHDILAMVMFLFVTLSAAPALSWAISKSQKTPPPSPSK